MTAPTSEHDANSDHHRHGSERCAGGGSERRRGGPECDHGVHRADAGADRAGGDAERCGFGEPDGVDGDAHSAARWQCSGVALAQCGGDDSGFGGGLDGDLYPATGVLSITGAATKAVYQSVLQGILYNDTSDTPTTSNRSITVVANDGAVNSATQTVTVTVTAVNDAPVAGDDAAATAEDTAVTMRGDAAGERQRRGRRCAGGIAER